MKEISEIIKFPFGVCSFSLLKDSLINCRNINRIPNNAQSVIIVAFPYKVKEEKPLNISRYAAVCDYHTVVEKYLEAFVKSLLEKYPNNKFVCFTDNSPIPEVYAGAVSGLGVKGKNGLLITKEYGSFVFLGEIVTDLYIESENRYSECINCGVCLKICPVHLNKEKCLSAVTQKKKDLNAEEQRLIRDNGSIWGCDICAEICPMNTDQGLSDIKEFINSYRNEYVLGEKSEDRAYNWRGEEVIKRNFSLSE